MLVRLARSLACPLSLPQPLARFGGACPPNPSPPTHKLPAQCNHCTRWVSYVSLASAFPAVGTPLAHMLDSPGRAPGSGRASPGPHPDASQRRDGWVPVGSSCGVAFRLSGSANGSAPPPRWLRRPHHRQLPAPATLFPPPSAPSWTGPATAARGLRLPPV